MPLLDRFTSKLGRQEAKPEAAQPSTFDPSYFTTVLDMFHEAVCFISTERRIIFWNRVAEEITGHQSQEVKGRFCHDHLLGHYDQDGNALCHVECPLTETLLRGLAVEKNAYLRHKDGYMVAVRLRTQVVRDELGAIIGAAEVFHTARSSESLEMDNTTASQEGMSDDAMPLPDHIMELIQEIHSSGGKVGLLFLRLDNYDGFVNQFGHMAGGKLLSLLEKTILTGFGSKGSVQHLRPDQFVLALPVTDRDALARMAKRTRSMVEGTCLTWWGRRVSLTASIGADLLTADEKLSVTIQTIRAKLDSASAAGGNRIVC